MFVNGSGQNEQSLQRTFHRCFLPSFGSFGQAVSEEKILIFIPLIDAFHKQKTNSKNMLIHTSKEINKSCRFLFIEPEAFLKTASGH